MENDTIYVVKNSVGSEGISLGKNNPISLHTDNKHVYRVTGMDQIEDIINTGYIKTKGYGVRAQNRGEIVYWTAGGDKLFYYDKRPVLEVLSTNIRDGQLGALSIDDLSAIWMFDEEQNKYTNQLIEVKRQYLLKKKEMISSLDDNQDRQL